MIKLANQNRIVVHHNCFWLILLYYKIAGNWLNIVQNNFIQIPFIRNLFEENNIGSNNSDTNNTDTRLDFYGGDGLSALIVAFIMIFVSLIGCGIMMNIYVHTTALVEQPLKLGRIEA